MSESELESESESESRAGPPVEADPTPTPDASSDPSRPWTDPRWVAQSLLLLESFERRLGRPLVATAEGASAAARAEALFLAPIVVVSHDTRPDPVLNYANRAALELWETTLGEMLRTPSRLTAEPVHRDERARLLATAAERGFVDHYAGVRISRTGRRFRIRDAIVWNLDAPDPETGRMVPRGQAATFDRWEPVGEGEN